MSWEEFELQSTKMVEGEKIYLVEGDMPVTHEQLRQYYDMIVKPAVSPAEFTTDGSPLAVNLFNGVDDLWSLANRFNLRYCVSTTFGVNYQRAINEMNLAAAAWERVADVDFIYLPAHDGNCTNTNPNVTFAVRPWTSGGACAFFPSGGACVPRTIVFDYVDFDTNPIWQQLAPNLTTGGVMIHEVGHTLGWRHEHTRNPQGCFEDNLWRALTVYDPGSTMHYPWCPGGVMTSNMQLTVRDGEGGANAYGWFTNMNDVDRRVEPAPEGDSFTFVMGQSFTTPFAVTIRHVDTCSWTGSGATTVQIRAGDNINGTVLATTNNVVQTAEPCGWKTSGYTWYRATFSPDVTLAAGTSFTTSFNNAGVMGLVFNFSNPYSGGAMWDNYNGGRRFATWDGAVRIVRPAP